MALDEAWGAAGRFRLPSVAASSSSAHTELDALHTPAPATGAHQLFSLENPLTAVVIIAALTVGAAAFSVSGRVGPTTATLAVGKT